MEQQLFLQLLSWNPWWQKGLEGIKRYNIPDYKRELYQEVYKQIDRVDQIISIVGMRQIGKSTMLRQMIKDLLTEGVSPKNILYVSFDDPYLKSNFNQTELFEKIIKTFSEAAINETLDNYKGKIYFFLDEIHQLSNWETILKSYYDRSFPIKFIVSGSSSIQLQKKNRESLLGRISENILWPFSFREYVEYKSKDEELTKLILNLKKFYDKFIYKLDYEQHYNLLNSNFNKIVLYKDKINKFLKSYIICGGFPRAWEEPDFISRQRFLWEGQVGKILFEDLVQTTNIRKPKELEFLLSYLIDYNGQEVNFTQLAGRLNLHPMTLDKYLAYLKKTFLVFQIDSTKSKRLAIKRKTGKLKFYLSDIAIRNAFYKKDESIFLDNEEMGLVAENLVCTLLRRWLYGAHKEEQISYYRKRNEEIDFIIKTPTKVIPIEVKWRNDIISLDTLDKITKEWKLTNDIVVTKDFQLTYKNGRLSIPLWFFLLSF